MSKDKEVLSNHVLDAIDHIEKYTADITKQEFLEDKKLKML
ncbi:MAG: hypothetical protein J07AB43_03080 [Candidatus Nanosalina sp. J07AB43]|nr:MAG: hypothetical protein J07AB43_03080 [Candidatus Nanosalina sp. J07AB43]